MALRKAIGTVKDQTSIGIVKVTSQLAPTLKIAILKATSHDEDPASEKHIREILTLSSYSRLHINACVRAISKRLTKTRDWIVALKVLVLINRLLREGDSQFLNEISHATRRGTRLLNFSDFRDEAHSHSSHHSAFIRTFAFYLDQKIEFLLNDTKETERDKPERVHRSVSDSDEYGRNYNERVPQRSHSYGDVGVLKEKKPTPPVREMKMERILSRMVQLQRLLDRFLACRPTGSAKNSRMVMFALYPLVEESFTIYGDVCEVLSVLLDRFFDMEHVDCLKVLEVYSSVGKQIDELVEFYNWCKENGVVRSSEFPEVQRITDKLLETLEEFIRDREKKPKSPEKEKEAKVVIEEQNLNEMKALPAPQPENCYSHPPEVKLEADPEQELGDLVDLREDTNTIVSSQDQSNKLALALFSAPATGALSGVTSAWQNPAAESGKADWELALVESVSHLSSQKTSLPGGFDPLLLNGMYDHGTVTQHMSTTQLSGGSASSVALPGLGKATSVLSLPAPDGSLQSLDQDPFAASMSIPPPSYVQMADMEKKQQLLVREQQIWNQYGREGMQGQVGLNKISGSGFYGSVPMGMVPYGAGHAGYYASY